MKIRAFGTQIVIFGILLFISNSVSAQSSSHNTGEPIDKSHHRTTEDTRGNKILSGEMLTPNQHRKPLERYFISRTVSNRR